MITEVIVSNYRSLGPDVHLRLGAMTALVGPNGSGKSNTADVFRFVSEALTVGLEAAIQNRHGIGAVRRWSAGRPNNLKISVTVKEETFNGNYSFTLGGDTAEDYRVKEESATVVPSQQSGEAPVEFRVSEGKWVSGPSDLHPKTTRTNLAMTLVAGDERFAPLASALRNTCIYSIFPDTLRKPQTPDTVRPMRKHGENWASTLQNMSDEGVRMELTAAMAKLTGDIEAFRVRQIGGYLNVEFLHHTERLRTKDRQKWFESDQESDGTLRVAGIITALLQTPPLTLIGIEEPELTVHVGAIPLLFDYLNQASRRQQVLVTTHSVDLLEKLDVDDIRVVERCGGVTRVGAVCADQREAVKKRLLTIGDLVSIEGGIQSELSLEG